MQTVGIKETAHNIIDQLPEDATWDDVVYRLAVRREIEKGLADSDRGRTVPVEELIREFGIDE